MKFPLLTGYTFRSQARTIDFSGVPNFDLRQLFCVTNLTARQDLYVVGDPELGLVSFAGSVVTLAYDTRPMADSDVLLVLVEDGVRLATASGQTAGNATLSNILAGLPALGQDASLQQILAAVQGQRAESLWTDDTGTFFVRVDKAGTISWTTPAGATSAGPGLGSRPAAGASVLLDKSSYQAITAGTGYAVGDLVDHVITSDPASGAIIGHFWLNVSQESVIAAPAAANLEPLSRLPDDAARASLQTANAAQAHTDMGTLAAATGAPSDAAAASDAAASGIIGLLRRGLVNWTALLARIPALGAAVKAASLPVTIASDQVVPVSATTSTTTTDASGAVAAAGTAVAVAANATRQLLILSNTGPNPLSYRLGAAATATVGHGLEPGATVVLDDKCPTGALNLFSTLGTTFFVTTG